MHKVSVSVVSIILLALVLAFSCASSAVQSGTSPTPIASGDSASAAPANGSGSDTKPQGLDAWTAAVLMAPGINIGNTLENTTTWETGWGNPLITREYVQALAKLGFKSVRLPVAWDTYAKDGVIQEDKFKRVEEVADWILDAGLFCVINIHWDGGWIDSSWQEKFPDTYATFSPVAEKKFRSYWDQIARRFANKGDHLIFEALNEETNFSNEGSKEDAFATLTRVNQIFIDTVRATGGNNPDRLLIVTGYSTDFEKTSSVYYNMPQDTVRGKLFVSVHYYTPWQFCGMTEDASWGRMQPTWGDDDYDQFQLDKLFDAMAEFCSQVDAPAFVGEFGVVAKKESASRIRWLSAVAQASIKRKMVPMLWDTGSDMNRTPPYLPSPDLQVVLDQLKTAK